MGRKDAGGHSGQAHVAPVDTYRKQIGKQDYKKSKKDAQARKRHSDQMKSAMTIQEVILVIGAGLAMLVGLYFVLFWTLGAGDGEVSKE